MPAILTLLLILTLSFLITRIATVTLVQTGLATQAARFQARSAFTGVGFTTQESEQIVAHPVRRRIVMMLMILGNAGVVTTMASLLLAFVGEQQSGWLERIGLLVVGLAILWIVASSSTVERALVRIIHRGLKRWTQLDVRDYASLLRIRGDYQILELKVEPQDWMAWRSLQELSLRDEGVLVLGIYRADGTYVGAPRGRTIIEPGDVLLIYGRDSAVQGLDTRYMGAAGDQAHEHAVAEQHRILSAEHKEHVLRSAREGRRSE